MSDAEPYLRALLLSIVLAAQQLLLRKQFPYTGYGACWFSRGTGYQVLHDCPDVTPAEGYLTVGDRRKIRLGTGDPEFTVLLVLDNLPAQGGSEIRGTDYEPKADNNLINPSDSKSCVRSAHLHGNIAQSSWPLASTKCPHASTLVLMHSIPQLHAPIISVTMTLTAIYCVPFTRRRYLGLIASPLCSMGTNSPGPM